MYETEALCELYNHILSCNAGFCDIDNAPYTQLVRCVMFFNDTATTEIYTQLCFYQYLFDYEKAVKNLADQKERSTFLSLMSAKQSSGLWSSMF